jgi:hypothetical protein
MNFSRYRVIYGVAQTLIVGLLIAIAGCATQVPRTTTVVAHRLMNNTFVRVGNIVSYSVSLDGPGISAIQLSTHCTTGKSWHLYSDIDGRRTYPNGDTYYSPAEITKIVTDRMPSEVDARCARTEDLRLVYEEESGGLQILVDRASIKSLDTVHRQVWVAYDYKSIAYDSPFRAPFAQKRELLDLDCGEATVAVRAGWDVDENGMVTDGLVFQVNDTVLAIGDYLTALRAVCGPSSALEALPKWTPRPKVKEAPLKKPAAVSSGILRNIEALGLKEPVKQLRGFKTEGTSSYEGGKPEPFGQSLVVESKEGPGIFHILLKSDDYESSKISFMGLEEISSATIFKVHGSSSVATTKLDFGGDWAGLPIGAPLSLTRTFTYSRPGGGDMSITKSTTCTVVAEAPASTVNPELSGTAKEVRCADEADMYKRVTTYWFLADYGFFFRVGDAPNNFYFSSSHIWQVTQ